MSGGARPLTDWPRRALGGIFALLLLTAVGPGGAAHADELVQVASQRASRAHHPSAGPLFGYLSRPRGPGRFPAVVLLHGCGGFGRHDIVAAARLRSWGYVALALDSLGDENACKGAGGSLAEAFDAYAALGFLAGQSFVQPNAIAVLGYSMGGLAALDTVERGLAKLLARGQAERFRAAVAYYPPCQGSSGDVGAPTLVLIGARDDWASAAACRDMAAHRDGTGVTRGKGTAPITLEVYPAATHAFDFDEPARRYLGHFMQYDRGAAMDAERRIRAFLAANLAAPTSDPGGPSAPTQRGH